MARSRKRRRHCQVLIALQRAYGGPVQTLEVTIVSLLPPSPSSPAQCSCCGRGCLGCGSSAYLLQKDDPVDYRILLTRGFCVVSRDAPPPPKLFTGDIPHPLESHSSTVDQLLHTPNWNLLLRRIGSELMIYLLRFSSIFIPIQRKSYYQLTGHPMNIVFRGSKILNTPSMSCNHDPFSKTMQNMALPNNKQKRKRDSINERSNMGSAAVPDPNTLFMIVSSESESLVSKANKKQRISKDPKRVIDRKKDVKLDGDELDMRFLSKDRFQNTSLNDSYSSGDCLSNKLRKQGRLFRWQRQRKKKARQENISGGRDMEISKMELLDSECNSCLPLQLSGTITSSASTEICSMCFYCFMMHHSQEVKTGVEIKRSYIFYNKSPSYSVFPRSHILNRLKPNDSDAIRLMKHIFGFPDGDKSFLTCIDCSHGSGMESQCLYHSLLCLLKSLIRNSRSCQRNKLLFKHCIQISKDHSQDIRRNSTLKKADNDPTIDAQSSPAKMKKASANSHDKFCHLLAENSCLSKYFQEVKHSDLELIESYSKHHQVGSFIWAVCRSIVPVSLLGNSSCWRSLQKNISKIVKLHKFENLNLRQCMHGIKMSCYSYLSKVRSCQCFCNGNRKFGLSENIRTVSKSINDQVLLRNLFSSWMHWFFSDMVVSIISANFYVTERESKKHELFYYPKPVWKKLVQQTITSLEEEKFRLLDEESAIGFFRNRRRLGFSKVRFLPKETCLRLLANLGKPSVVQFPKHGFDSRCCFRSFKGQTEIHGKHSSPCGRTPVKYFSVNSVLKELDTILRRVKIEKPELLGSSVFDYNDVYQKIHQFLSKAKIRQSEKPNIYIVVADVLKAFDSIDQDKLIAILDNILENDMYGISRHAMISCRKGYFGTTYDHCLPCGCNNSNFASIFGPSFQSLPTNSILIDQYEVVWKKKRQLLLLLKEHLKHNILQIGQDFFLQKVGIPQGSILSTLLCSYYYGDMEKKMILPLIERNSKDLLVTRSSYASNYCTTEMETDNVKYLWQPKITVIGKNNDHHAKEANAVALDMDNSIVEESLLLRFIDDFLFISTSKEQATRFFNRIGRGFSSYNCFMNKKKFGMNFDVAQKSCLVNRVYTGGDGVSFLPWSGLLINCQTLEIQADYTRYFGIHIRDTVTIKLHAKPLYHLKRQMFLFVRLRCHPIFYDSNINSLTVVSLNAYQAILLSAMKFHCYVHSMKDVTELDPMYLVEIIERSFRYMYKHIKKLMRDILYRFGIRASLDLQKKEMLWLGLYAYARVLRKKHSQHKKLLSLLMSKISQHESIEDAPLHLRYALDESHSSCFLKLKF